MTTNELLNLADCVALEAFANKTDEGWCRIDEHRAAVLASARAAVRTVLTDLDALLCPEKYPGHDPDHEYWDSHDPTDPELPDYEWPVELIEGVAQWVDIALGRLTVNRR